MASRAVRALSLAGLLAAAGAAFVATRSRDAAVQARDASSAGTPFYDYRGEAPGTVHHITPADLPPPYAPPIQIDAGAPPPASWPQVPDGFVAERYLTGLDNPRLVRRAPNGDLFVAETAANRVRVVRDRDNAPPMQDVFAAGLTEPFGIAFYPPDDPRYVYVANTNSIVRFAYAPGDMRARAGAETVIPRLLATDAGGHSTRDIAFSPDGRTLYVSIGSASNVDDVDGNAAETNRADILETNPNGGDLRLFASGLRNPVSIAIDPATGDLWTTVNERDLLGDNLPPDYLTAVRRGGFFGWPWFYTGGNQDPRHAGKHAELQHLALVPDVLLQPHTAPLGWAFYDGDQFGDDYRGDVFVAQHGSWNRSVPTGYAVVRVRRDAGRATGEYEDFMTGFVGSGGAVRGRPVGVAVAADGSLVVTDDFANVVWRVRRLRSAAGARAPR